MSGQREILEDKAHHPFAVERCRSPKATWKTAETEAAIACYPTVPGLCSALHLARDAENLRSLFYRSVEPVAAFYFYPFWMYRYFFLFLFARFSRRRLPTPPFGAQATKFT